MTPRSIGHAIVLGRACLDLYASPVGISLVDARTFDAHLGGSPANIAVGLARLGVPVAMATCVAPDRVGAFVRKRLEAFGIDTTYVRDAPGTQTSVVLGAFEPPEGFDLVFYRDRAADLALETGNVSPQALIDASLVVTSGTGLSALPSRQATLEALATAGSGSGVRAFVVDHRPAAWRAAEPDEIAAQYRRAIRSSDVVIGNSMEIALASENSDWRLGARDVARDGASVVVVTRGAQGSAVLVDGELTEIPAAPARAANVVGAGDAFAASFLYSLLNGADAVASARFGAAAAAIVVERHACSSAMPTEPEIVDRLSQGRGDT